MLQLSLITSFDKPKLFSLTYSDCDYPSSFGLSSLARTAGLVPVWSASPSWTTGLAWMSPLSCWCRIGVYPQWYLPPAIKGHRSVYKYLESIVAFFDYLLCNRVIIINQFWFINSATHRWENPLVGKIACQIDSPNSWSLHVYIEPSPIISH